jgi:hypothetical protein
MRNTKLRNVEYKIFGTLQSKDEVVTTNYIEPIDAKIKVIGRMAVGDGFIADFFAAEMIREKIRKKLLGRLILARSILVLLEHIKLN